MNTRKQITLCDVGDRELVERVRNLLRVRSDSATVRESLKIALVVLETSQRKEAHARQE
jgi:hypothetical protein